jgi:hypothetical protein
VPWRPGGDVIDAAVLRVGRRRRSILIIIWHLIYDPTVRYFYPVADYLA